MSRKLKEKPVPDTEREIEEKIAEEEVKSPENDPCIDRGERIATGKAIARGGKSAGSVPGAQSQPT